MPPEENKLKIGIDPIFTGQKPVDKTVPASAYNTLTNQKYIPDHQGRASDLQGGISLMTNKNTNPNPKSIVRTYKGDIESAIQTNHLSSINIAVAENEKMHSQIQAGQEENVSTEDYSKNKIIIFISVILIIIGLVSLSVVYFFRNQNSNQTIPVQELPSLITTEYKDELDTQTIIANRLISALASKLNDIQIPVNNFYQPYLTIGTGTARRLITSTEFVSLMNWQMPDIIKRTLLPDFMVGMYSFGQNLPFVILKTSYFENAYTGLLAWETDLEKDFQNLFRLTGYENSGEILTDLTPINAKKFEDGVIVNKDVRLIRDANKNIILLYGIIDKETIIITVNDTAFKEIVNRLNKEKTLRR